MFKHFVNASGEFDFFFHEHKANFWLTGGLQLWLRLLPVGSSWMLKCEPNRRSIAFFSWMQPASWNEAHMEVPNLRVVSFWAFCVTRCQRVILKMTRWTYLRREKNFKANRYALLYLFQTIFKSFLNCALPLHYLYVACLSSAHSDYLNI